MQKSQTCTKPKAIADEHNEDYDQYDDNSGDSDKTKNREIF